MRVIPWITDGSLDFLNGYILEFKLLNRRQPAVLEFGMGDSTFYFSALASYMMSFEHEAAWYHKVVATLRAQGLPEWDLHLEERPYSDRIAERTRGRKFDIIFIDGRDRVACLQKCLEVDLVAPGGIVLIDNTERLHTWRKGRYKPMLELLSGDFELIHFEQIGMDKTSWTSRSPRWITTVGWRTRDSGPFSSAGRLMTKDVSLYSTAELRDRNTRLEKTIKHLERQIQKERANLVGAEKHVANEGAKCVSSKKHLAGQDSRSWRIARWFRALNFWN